MSSSSPRRRNAAGFIRTRQQRETLSQTIIDATDVLNYKFSTLTYVTAWNSRNETVEYSCDPIAAYLTLTHTNVTVDFDYELRTVFNATEGALTAAVNDLSVRILEQLAYGVGISDEGSTACVVAPDDDDDRRGRRLKRGLVDLSFMDKYESQEETELPMRIIRVGSELRDSIDPGNECLLLNQTATTTCVAVKASIMATLLGTDETTATNTIRSNLQRQLNSGELTNGEIVGLGFIGTRSSDNVGMGGGNTAGRDNLNPERPDDNGTDGPSIAAVQGQEQQQQPRKENVKGWGIVFLIGLCVAFALLVVVMWRKRRRKREARRRDAIEVMNENEHVLDVGIDKAVLPVGSFHDYGDRRALDQSMESGVTAPCSPEKGSAGPRRQMPEEADDRSMCLSCDTDAAVLGADPNYALNDPPPTAEELGSKMSAQMMGAIGGFLGVHDRTGNEAAVATSMMSSDDSDCDSWAQSGVVQSFETGIELTLGSFHLGMNEI